MSLLLAAPVVCGTELTLEYRAFLAGTAVGRATVTVAVDEDDGGYRVEGDARSNSWLKGFTRWRNRFSAYGLLQGLERQPAEFAYAETDSNKSRQVVVRDGTMQVTKNGKERPPRPSPPGPDVVSALFVLPHCRGDQVIHTGRHVYRLTRLKRDAGGCRYAVVDDDNDTFDLELVLARHGGLVVPKKITVHGWVTGWVELVEEAAH